MHRRSFSRAHANHTLKDLSIFARHSLTERHRYGDLYPIRILLAHKKHIGGTSMGDTIHLNEEEVKSQLSEMVRETVEKTLNQLLDA